MGGGGYLAIERRNGDAVSLPCGKKLSPHVSGAGIEAEKPPLHPPTEADKPREKSGLPLSPGQILNAATKLANGDGADVEILLMVAQPCHHPGVRPGLCEFAENIRIDQITHSTIEGEKSLARGGTSKGDGQASR